MNKLFNKLFKIGQTAGMRVFGALAQLLLYFVASHISSPIEVAPLFFSLNLASLATPILMRGYHSFATKEIASISDEDTKISIMIGILYAHLKTLLPISIITLIIGSLVCHFFNISNDYLFLIIPILFIIPIFSQIGYFFQAYKKYNIAIFILNIIYPMLILIGMLLLKLIQKYYQTHIPSIILTIPASILSLAIAYLLLRKGIMRNLQSIKNIDKFEPSKEQKAIINKFWLSYIVTYIGLWAPIVIFYGFGSKVQYSYYSIADRIANVVNFFLIVSSFIVSPVIAELYAKRNSVELEKMVINATRITTVLAVPFVFVLIFFTKDILYLFNKDYVGAAIFLQILTIAQFYNILTGCVNPILLMTGHLNELIKSSIYAVICEAICFIILPHYFDDYAFAIAFLVYSFVQNSMSVYYVNRMIKVNLFKAFIPFSIQRSNNV